MFLATILSSLVTTLLKVAVSLASVLLFLRRVLYHCTAAHVLCFVDCTQSVLNTKGLMRKYSNPQ